jgi:ABC-type histidine transport system ATPase subunit
MFGGQVVESGPPSQVFNSPREERVRAFLAEAEGA